MNRFINYSVKWAAALVVLPLWLCSCKKLVGVPPNIPSQINQQQVFVDSADILGAIAGVYNNFNVTLGTTGFFNGGITINSGLTGDELIATTTFSLSPDLEYYHNTLNAMDNFTLPMWDPPYNALYQVNVCLENIPLSHGITDSTQLQLLGELKVVRALYYFYLVNLFGPVPRVTSSNYMTNTTLPR